MKPMQFLKRFRGALAALFFAAPALPAAAVCNFVEGETNAGDLAADCHQDGQKNGHWRSMFNSGTVSEGNFVGGQRDGLWRDEFADGRIIEGEYAAGAKHGKWKLIFADGLVSEGEYADGKQTGQWQNRYADGREERGRLVDGVKQGEWVHSFPSGGESAGVYVDGKRDGVWVNRFDDGQRDRDCWQEGEKVAPEVCGLGVKEESAEAVVAVVEADAGVAASAAEADETAADSGLAGDYFIRGTTPAGKDYIGTAHIQYENGKYELRRQIGGETHIAEGEMLGENLVVKSAADSAFGSELMLYTAGADGVLQGTWGGGEGGETLRSAAAGLAASSSEAGAAEGGDAGVDVAAEVAASAVDADDAAVPNESPADEEADAGSPPTALQIAAIAPKCKTPTKWGDAACYLPLENRDDCYVWDAFPHRGETVTWSGRCRAGLADGPGEGVWTWQYGEGETRREEASGSFAAGKRDGKWVLRWGDGEREGEYLDGKRHGRWLERLADGGTECEEYDEDDFVGEC